MSVVSTLSFVLSKHDDYNYKLFEKPVKKDIQTTGGIAFKTIVCFNKIMGSILNSIPFILYGFYRCAVSVVFMDSFVGLCSVFAPLVIIFTSCYWCTCVSDRLSFKACQRILKSQVMVSVSSMILFIIAGVILIIIGAVFLGLLSIICGACRLALSFLCQLIALG